MPVSIPAAREQVTRICSFFVSSQDLGDSDFIFHFCGQ
jgi:hypothetical protein